MPIARRSTFCIRLAVCAASSLALAMPASAQDDSPRLTPERLAASPSLNGATPRGVQFSPDGGLLTFLRGKDTDFRQTDLWAFDLQTGEERLLVDSTALRDEPEDLSEEEKARRERMRISGSGIVSYQWDSQGDAILVPLAGDVFYAGVSSGEDPQISRLTETEADEIDAKISPAGGFVSFVRAQNLYVVDIASGDERAITTAGADAVSFGVAEFVAQEEMRRYTGYWWSPDDARIAYTKVDESRVDIIPRFDIGAEGVSVIEQRYPRAGTDNAVVELFVRDLDSGADVQVDLGENDDIYLARVNWLDAETLVVQRQNRTQDRMDVLAVDATTGISTVLFTETSETWINLNYGFRALDDGARFLWMSERDGFSHIYLYSADGTLLRQVTEGEWAVTGISAVNEDKGEVIFSARKDTPLESHAYWASFEDPKGAMRITEPGAWWGASFNADASAFVGTSSHPNQPPQAGLYNRDGTRIRWIEENALDADHPYAPYLPRHLEPQFGTIKAADGETDLYYSLLVPPHCDAANPCPAIHYVYGGPGVQIVRRSWQSTRSQMWAQTGYVVFSVDNRGSDNRGKAFDDPLHLAMGGVEVDDQLVGAQFLKSQDMVDPDRVGVFGWSYGGYMTLHMLTQHPGVWAAGVSGAPVSDWSLYDTHYTERFMGLPEDNPEGYQSASVLPLLDRLADPLFMIHGMADDNVTFDNSTRVFSALQEANTPFEVMVYPGQRHGIRGEGRSAHLWNAIMAFLDRELDPEPAP